jgi:hypothetical protein
VIELRADRRGLQELEEMIEDDGVPEEGGAAEEDG